jgi:hypothetical protein
MIRVLLSMRPCAKLQLCSCVRVTLRTPSAVSCTRPVGDLDVLFLFVGFMFQHIESPRRTSTVDLPSSLPIVRTYYASPGS